MSHPRFAQQLHDDIVAEIERLKSNLASGVSINTIEDYKFTVGKIQGLILVMDWFEDIEHRLNNPQ